MEQAEFNDPRLVAVYDAEYGWDDDDELFVSLVQDEPTQRVLDLGCGTGRLSLGLAARGCTVTGVDPALASLDAARTKPGAEAVRWIHGTSRDLPQQEFQVALMTSHVAQFIVTDDDWARTLTDLRGTLEPGGRLIFDSRDPRDQRWLRWNERDSRRRVQLPDGRHVDTWAETSDIVRGCVDVVLRYVFSDGLELKSTATMRFRTEDEVRVSLQDNGFRVEQIYGGWQREPVRHPDGELLVVARRSA